MRRRALNRGVRRVGQSGVLILGLLCAAAFVFWNADVWVLRDKIEHLRTALFGAYVHPDCRGEPRVPCRNGMPIKKGSTKPVSSQTICSDNPGLEFHCRFQTLYADFNRELFENRLPPAVITLQRGKGYRGFFAHRRFKTPNGKTIDEIALNPQVFGRISMRILASTLVHEMVHLEQAHFGTPRRGDFHNKEWGELMRRVGLEPSSTGRPGGRTIGVRMTHYIVPGGRFDQMARVHPMIRDRKVP